MERITLRDKIQQKSTNIEFFRFIAALGVLAAHAHVLSDGSSDWLYHLTGVTWGGLAVCYFFFVSGLYVSKSLIKCRKGSRYFAARIKRLIPPLAVVVFVTVLILGPCITILEPGEYFRNTATWKYLANICLIPVHTLPGVFVSGNLSSTVNGSLWTLPLEFLCYVILFVMYKLGLMRKERRAIWGTGIAVVSILSYWTGSRMSSSVILSAAQAVILFFMGAFYYLIKDDLIISRRVGVAAVFGWVVVSWLKLSFFGNVLFLPVIITVFLIGTKQMKSRLSDLGKLSYAIYLTAFLVQQMMIEMCGGTMSPYLNMVVSIPAVIIVSCGLYLLERRK